ncbi:FecR domain-containing protein [Chitinophaga alhagiae]|uniref:FecR domain-containing protein n=1 Tax=Chitinophaga alhagiae TaxID=2203219 RepID=UPI000E5B8CDA|nr:FecR domain-containing protein [Chitinophaga alhagiae]
MDHEEIQELILKEHYGLLSPEEQERLNALLAASEEARSLREEVRNAVPKEEALEAMEHFDVEKSYDLIQHEAALVRQRKRRNMLAGAVTVLLLVAGAAWYILSPGAAAGPEIAAGEGGAAGVTLKLANGQRIALNDSGRQTITIDNATLTANNRQLEYNGEGDGSGWNTLTVPPRLDFQVKLADGTLVWLNSISEIKFPFHFNETKREVYIKGEAYFKVAPDAGKPFIVHTSNTHITVLGTEFNVNAYNQGIITTSLVNGKVAVAAEERQVELKPGTEAVVRGEEQIKVQPFDNDLITWRRGVYYFEESPMREIAAMVERWYDVKVVMDNADVAGKVFRIKLFRNRPVQEVVDQINETGLVKMYWENNVLHCK